MNFGRMTLAAALVMGALVSEARAQRKLFPFSAGSREAPATTDLTQEAGPWLILCASFVGETAQADADRLAVELRQQGLRTYTYRQVFDFSQPVPGLFLSEHFELDANGNAIPQQQKMKIARGASSEEVAVLVGDFPNIEDNRAQSTLKQIKSMRVRTLGGVARDQLAREVTTDLARQHDSPGQLAGAFLIVNPMLPDEYFARPAVDRDILNLNQQFAWSLLKCPAAYSVRVATFRGDVTFETEQIERARAEERSGPGSRKSAAQSKLAEAGLKASVLTKKLRERGVEAWEYHDRFESYVCVGSFSWISKTHEDGTTEFNQALIKTIEEFKGEVTTAFGQSGVLKPRTMPGLPRDLGIAFDIQPVPVQVPRAPGDRRTASSNQEARPAVATR